MFPGTICLSFWWSYFGEKLQPLDLKKMSQFPQHNKLTNILFSAKNFLLTLAGPQGHYILILRRGILRDKYNLQLGNLV
jgi:hypothetical protein